jgi:hypothetical protein
MFIKKAPGSEIGVKLERKFKTSRAKYYLIPKHPRPAGKSLRALAKMIVSRLFPSRLILTQRMTNLKKILITTERREVFIVRPNGGSRIRGFCPRCAEEVALLTLDEAVSFSACRTRELIRRIECDAVHSVETSSGHLLVCRNSLQDFLKGE